MAEQDNLLLKAYFMRHQESVQNAEGRGHFDTPLTQEGQEKANALSRILRDGGLRDIDVIMSGTLQRHEQTLDGVLRDSGYNGDVLRTPVLNAILGDSRLLRQSSEATVREFGLDRFKPGKDGLYHGEDSQGVLSFDPAELGIFPLDPLYCRAYQDQRLRELVFGGDVDLRPLADVGRDVADFQRELVTETDLSEPGNVLIISSCSTNGLQLEHAIFDTVGVNNVVREDVDGVLRISRYGTDGNPIFPQEHGQMAVLGYTEKDREMGRGRLRALEGNTDIDKYIDRLDRD